MLEASAAALDKLFRVDPDMLCSIPVLSSKSSSTFSVFGYTGSLVTDTIQIQKVHLEKPLYNMLPHPYLGKDIARNQVHIIFQVDKKTQYYA